MKIVKMLNYIMTFHFDNGIIKMGSYMTISILYLTANKKMIKSLSHFKKNHLRN